MVNKLLLKGCIIASLCLLLFLYFKCPYFILLLNENNAKQLKEYRITDSIPAIGNSIQKFEAFRVFDSAGEKSNYDGSMSYSKQNLRPVIFEYYSREKNIDSVVIFSIEHGGRVQKKTILLSQFPRRYIRLKAIDTLESTWSRHTFAYISYPKSIMSINLSSRKFFNRLEGGTIDLIPTFYDKIQHDAINSDTTYQTPDEYSDVDFAINENSIAALNGTNEDIQASIYAETAASHEWFYIKIHSKSVAIYRNLINSKCFRIIAITGDVDRNPIIRIKNKSNMYFALERKLR